MMGKAALKLAEPTGPLIEERRVDNPTVAWAEFLHQLEHGNPDAGVQRAMVNMTTLCGGFARFRGTEAQQRAAARFLSVYEQSQLGGSRAVDPSIEAVDGGYRNPEAIFEIGADARREHQAIQDLLGRVDYAKFRFVVVGCNGPTAFARHWYKIRRPDGMATSKAHVEVRKIADRLAVHMRLQSA
jgi:hypothetical protein